MTDVVVTHETVARAPVILYQSVRHLLTFQHRRVVVISFYQDLHASSGLVLYPNIPSGIVHGIHKLAYVSYAKLCRKVYLLAVG